MRASRVLASFVLALGALTGCGTGEPESPAPPTTSAPDPASAFLEPGLRFSEEAQQAYLVALEQVDAKLAQDDQALEHGMAICVDDVRAKTDAEIIKNAAARLDVDDATATQIVQAARTSLCRV
ncbi:DUF732 domain-containing protein [Actinoplanes sp. GCM10030250]|uniref:DUF732 domain-containing protein n=1 Tax=Actinoplanes sp. GCM10030250 TaxID=3273376 RepID=UPI00361DCB6E